MKNCSYCGRDNADDAANCRECGTVFTNANQAAESGEDTKQTPEKKTLAIRIFPTRELAELAAAKLKANGIESWLDADDCAGMIPSLTFAVGARLNILEEDESIATTVLEAKPTPEESKNIEIEAVLAASPPPERKNNLP